MLTCIAWRVGADIRAVGSAFVFASWLAAGAAAQEVGKPTLRIRDPFVAPIWRMSVDRQGAMLAASSAAKAVTVWSLSSPDRAPDIHRIPIREEEQQRAHAVALSPNGEKLAYSVPPLRQGDLPLPGSARIYVMSPFTGTISSVLDGVATRPQDLKFSPDGQLLGAVLSDGCGLRLWSTKDWHPAGAHDEGYGNADGSCSLAGAEPAFIDPLPDTTSILFATSSDGETLILTSGHTGLRVYAYEKDALALVRHWAPDDLGLEQPDGLALSPDGHLLAIGDGRAPAKGGQGTIRLRVALFDMEKLNVRRHLEIGENEVVHPGYLDLAQAPGANQLSLNRVAWQTTEDGQHVIAGGGFPCEVAPPEATLGPVADIRLDNCLVRWKIEAQDDAAAKPVFLRAGVDRIMDLATIREGAAIVYATARQIAALGKVGDLVALNEAGTPLDSRGRLLDLRDAAKVNDAKYPTYLDFAISPDAERVFIEDIRSTDKKPIKLVFDLKKRSLERYQALPEDARPPVEDPLQIAPPPTWKNQRTPPEIFKIVPDLPSLTVDRYRSIATAPDGIAVLGSSNYIRLLKAENGKLNVICELRVSSEANRVNMTTDAKLIVAGHSDGTIRWYAVQRNTADGTCSLIAKLDVSIRESAPGSGVWTWIATLPQTGYFAADVNAEDLTEWQVTGPQGQVAKVETQLLWQTLLQPGRVQKALITDTKSDNAASALNTLIRERIDPATVHVLQPQHRAIVRETSVALEIDAVGRFDPPRKLYVRSGSGKPLRYSLGNSGATADSPFPVTSPGKKQLTVELSDDMRGTPGEKHICFALDDWPKGCHLIRYAGPPPPPKPKKLHALFIGVANYNDKTLNLNATDNDAIDFATLLIEDAARRRSGGPPTGIADFDDAEFDLLVSPSNLEKAAELSALAKSPNVRVFEASREKVLEILANWQNAASSTQNLDHRYLLFFAGHGYVDLRDGKNRAAFLLPTMANKSSIFDRSILGETIIDSLQRLAGEKVAIFDACRTPIAAADDQSFDPARLEHEFVSRAPDTTLIFGSKAGQVAREQSAFVWRDRSKGSSGNGLFTYALLKSLTSVEADTSLDSFGKGRIQLHEVDQYLSYFFNMADQSSPASELMRTISAPADYLQQPSLVAPRNQNPSAIVMRTLDTKPSQAKAMAPSAMCGWPFLNGYDFWCK